VSPGRAAYGEGTWATESWSFQASLQHAQSWGLPVSIPGSLGDLPIALDSQSSSCLRE
jgi:hypothetical protein